MPFDTSWNVVPEKRGRGRPRTRPPKGPPKTVTGRPPNPNPTPEQLRQREAYARRRAARQDDGAAISAITAALFAMPAQQACRVLILAARAHAKTIGWRPKRTTGAWLVQHQAPVANKGGES
jgi:hypothetical protein